MPALSWDEATAYDLFVSLYVLHRPEQFGLRPSWAAGVRSRLPAVQREFFDKAQSCLPVPLRWLYLLPAGSRDAADALTALAHIPTTERLAALSHSSEQTPELTAALSNISLRQSWNPAELEVIRTQYQRKGILFKQTTLHHLCEAWAHPAEFGEQYLQALTVYQQVFFAEEEQRIRPALTESSQRASEMAGRLSLASLLEELSRGVHFAALEELDEVILVPSYWSTPLVFYNHVVPGKLMVLFGCRAESQHLIPGETVPGGLVDSLKAIADPSRLAILRFLAEEPLAPGELARRLRLRPPTVIHHLNALRLAGLVEITLLPGAERRYALREEAMQGILASLQNYLRAPEDKSSQ
jgi:DNA-binding transcriptional ArsR family regulator